MRYRAGLSTLALAAAALAGCASGDSPTRSTATVKTQAPAQVAVPPVRGEGITAATARLKQAQLRWRVQRRYAPESEGRVLTVDPGTGVVVRRGTEVDLVVSLGPKPQSVTTTTPPAAGSSGAAPAPPSSSGSPPVNSPQGQRALHNSPDCQNAPPPPPGYTGPVQC